MDLHVVVNGTEDHKSEDFLRQNGHPYTTIERTTPASARNLAVKLSSSDYDYFGFADDDIIFPRSYFDHLDEILKEDSWDVLGGPDLTYPNSPPFERAIGLSLASPMATASTRNRHRMHKTEGVRQCDEKSLILCALWFKSDIFYKGHGFPPNYFRNEENVLLHQLSLEKYTFGISPKLHVFHKRKGSPLKLFFSTASSGFHRVKSFEQFPESSDPIYFIPMFFVLYLMSLMFYRHPLWLSLLPCYVLLNISFAWIVCSKNKSTVLLPYVVLIQFLINVFYGIGFLRFIFSKNIHEERSR